MKYDPQKDVIGLDRDIIRAAKTKANMRLSLSHYSNIDALERIVVDSALRFNRIDFVNDQKERLFLKKPINYMRIFVACFTNSETEYIPHWYMYGKDERGVRITYVKKDKNEEWHKSFLDYEKPVSLCERIDDSKFKRISDHDWVNWDIPNLNVNRYPLLNQDWQFELSTTDIVYGEENLKHSPSVIPCTDSLDLVTAATVKNDAWCFESETRMIAIARSCNENEIIEANFLLMPIQWGNFDHIVITFSPWMTDGCKERVRKICRKKFTDDFCQIQDSIFEGQIRK